MSGAPGHECYTYAEWRDLMHWGRIIRKADVTWEQTHQPCHRGDCACEDWSEHWPDHGPRIWSCAEGECRRCDLEQDREEAIAEALDGGEAL